MYFYKFPTKNIVFHERSSCNIKLFWRITYTSLVTTVGSTAGFISPYLYCSPPASKGPQIPEGVLIKMRGPVDAAPSADILVTNSWESHSSLASDGSVYVQVQQNNRLDKFKINTCNWKLKNEKRKRFFFYFKLLIHHHNYKHQWKLMSKDI